MVNSPDTIKAVSLCVSYADIISVTHFCPDLSCPVSRVWETLWPHLPWQGAFGSSWSARVVSFCTFPCYGTTVPIWLAAPATPLWPLKLNCHVFHFIDHLQANIGPLLL